VKEFTSSRRIYCLALVKEGGVKSFAGFYETPDTAHLFSGCDRFG